MKTLITAAILALSTTAAAAHTCGFADADIKNYPGYATDGNTYDRGDYLFTANADYDNSVVYHTYTNKATCNSNTVAIDTQTKDVTPVKVVKVVEVVIAGVVTQVTEVTEVSADGETVTTTQFWGVMGHANKDGDYREVTTTIETKDGKVISNITKTEHWDGNGNTMRIDDNHLTGKAWRVRANSDNKKKDYRAEGDRTRADEGNWLDKKPEGFRDEDKNGKPMK